MASSKTTTQLGLVIPDVNCPDDQPGGPIFLLSAAVALLDVHVASLETNSGSGAITNNVGVVYITDPGVATLTLAAPVAGLPSAGGADGNELTIVSATAYAHTVTTPANAINGANHVLTFAATKGTQIKLMAYQGVWYVEPSAPGITIS